MWKIQIEVMEFVTVRPFLNHATTKFISTWKISVTQGMNSNSITFTHTKLYIILMFPNRNKTDITGALFTLSLSILIFNCQCKEGARQSIFVPSWTVISWWFFQFTESFPSPQKSDCEKTFHALYFIDDNIKTPGKQGSSELSIIDHVT